MSMLSPLTPLIVPPKGELEEAGRENCEKKERKIKRVLHCCLSSVVITAIGILILVDCASQECFEGSSFDTRKCYPLCLLGVVITSLGAVSSFASYFFCCYCSS